MQKLDPPKLCLDLNLFLDKDGLNRVMKSARNFPGLTYDQQNPLLFDFKSEFVSLLARSCHRTIGHMGLKAITVNTSIVNQEIASCQMCITQRGKIYHNNSSVHTYNEIVVKVHT